MKNKDLADGISQLKETILKDYPKLTRLDKFSFLCHNKLKCFNQCCRDVTIFLTPYDIIRMKNHLGITSQEFLSKYTVSPFVKDQPLPAIVLKMRDDDEKTCPFVEDAGCSIYGNRPWSCRMYPLGVGSKPKSEGHGKEFFFLMKDDLCEGLSESREWTVEEWMENQGITDYDEMGEFFKEISLHPRFQEGQPLDPQRMEMYHMVCFNLDKFRRFLFESTFFEKFDVSSEEQQVLKEDDVELYKFGIKWLRFSLFGEDTLKIKPEVEERIRKGDAAE